MIADVRRLQPIMYRGRIVAVTVAGQAIIDGSVVGADLLHVQAKCLYALELADKGRLDGYTDADAEMYAETARMYRQYGHLRERAAGGA